MQRWGVAGGNTSNRVAGVFPLETPNEGEFRVLPGATLPTGWLGQHDFYA